MIIFPPKVDPTDDRRFVYPQTRYRGRTRVFRQAMRSPTSLHESRVYGPGEILVTCVKRLLQQNLPRGDLSRSNNVPRRRLVTIVSRGLARPYPSRTCTAWIAPVFPGAFHLFDNLVGKGEECRGKFNTEQLRRFEIKDELEVGGLLHRQIRRLGAFQYFVHVACSTAI